MAVCFCGCGTKVGAFQIQRKSANKMGARIHGLVVALERDVMPQVRERQSQVVEAQGQEQADSSLAVFETAVAEGRASEESCRQVVHEEAPFASVDWPKAREWIKKAEGMTAMFRLSPEQQQRIINDDG